MYMLPYSKIGRIMFLYISKAALSLSRYLSFLSWYSLAAVRLILAVTCLLKASCSSSQIPRYEKEFTLSSCFWCILIVKGWPSGDVGFTAFLPRKIMYLVLEALMCIPLLVYHESKLLISVWAFEKAFVMFLWLERMTVSSA